MHHLHTDLEMVGMPCRLFFAVLLSEHSLLLNTTISLSMPEAHNVCWLGQEEASATLCTLW